MPDIAVLYEHPQWFRPLFAALDRRGTDFSAIRSDGFAFDPGRATVLASFVFNRIAMSGFLRSPEHPIFHATAALAR